MCIKNDPHAGNKRWARSAAGPPPLRAAVGLRRDRRRLLMALALLFVVDIGFSARAAGERRAGIGSQARGSTSLPRARRQATSFVVAVAAATVGVEVSFMRESEE
jgi:hypothetical protein